MARMTTVVTKATGGNTKPVGLLYIEPDLQTLTAWLARHEPDPMLKQALDFALLEHDRRSCSCMGWAQPPPSTGPDASTRCRTRRRPSPWITEATVEDRASATGSASPTAPTTPRRFCAR